MNFFERKTTCTNPGLAPVIPAVASVYLLPGVRFPQFFGQFTVPMIVLFTVTVFWTLYLWITKIYPES